MRFGFGIMMMLLLMVIAAGLGLLTFLAMRVPAITSEFNAWMGRPSPSGDLTSARRAQVIFATFLYSAPIGLGIFVYVLHFVVNWINVRIAESRPDDDEQFRME